MSEATIGIVSLLVGVVSLLLGALSAWPMVRDYLSSRATRPEVTHSARMDLYVARMRSLCTDPVALVAYAVSQLVVILLAALAVLVLGNPEIVPVDHLGQAWTWAAYARVVLIWGAVATVGLLSARLYGFTSVVLAYRDASFSTPGSRSRSREIAEMMKAYGQEEGSAPTGDDAG